MHLLTYTKRQWGFHLYGGCCMSMCPIRPNSSRRAPHPIPNGQYSTAGPGGRGPVSSFMQSEPNLPARRILVSDSMKDGYATGARFAGREAKPIFQAGDGGREAGGKGPEDGGRTADDRGQRTEGGLCQTKPICAASGPKMLVGRKNKANQSQFGRYSCGLGISILGMPQCPCDLYTFR